MYINFIVIILFVAFKEIILHNLLAPVLVGKEWNPLKTSLLTALIRFVITAMVVGVAYVSASKNLAMLAATDIVISGLMGIYSIIRCFSSNLKAVLGWGFLLSLSMLFYGLGLFGMGDEYPGLLEADKFVYIKPDYGMNIFLMIMGTFFLLPFVIWLIVKLVEYRKISSLNSSRVRVLNLARIHRVARKRIFLWFLLMLPLIVLLIGLCWGLIAMLAGIRDSSGDNPPLWSFAMFGGLCLLGIYAIYKKMRPSIKILKNDFYIRIRSRQIIREDSKAYITERVDFYLVYARTNVIGIPEVYKEYYTKTYNPDETLARYIKRG